MWWTWQRPNVKNLINIYSGFSAKTLDEVKAEFGDANFATFKQNLTELLIEKISPIRNTISELIADRTYLENILESGNIKALEIAEKNILDIKTIAGLK